MPYDPTKDQLLWEAPISPTGLMVQIKSYNNSEPKIKCMRQYTKRDQSVATSPAYGLTLEDFMYIGQFWDQMKTIIINSRNDQQNDQQPNQNYQQQPNQNYQPQPNYGFGS